METLLEQTVGMRAHTYLVDLKRGKMLAYRRDDDEIQVFSQPMTFSQRYRKFREVVDTQLETAYTNTIG